MSGRVSHVLRFRNVGLLPRLQPLLPVSGFSAGVGDRHDLNFSTGSFSVNQDKRELS